MWLKVVLICLTIESWKTDAKSYPENTVVFVGQTVTMNCRVSRFENAAWRHVSSATSVTYQISSGGNVSSERYNLVIDTTRSQYDLVINETMPKDSGTYVCTSKDENSAIEKKFTGQLIILISDPECGTDLNRTLAPDEHVAMWCVLKYTGFLTPAMVWKQGVHGWIIPSKEDIHANNKVEARINVEVGLCENGVTFSCTTYFPESDILNASIGKNIIIAINVPKYKYIWTSPVLKVQVTQFSWKDGRAIALVVTVTIFSVALILQGAFLTKIYYEKMAGQKVKWLQRDNATKEMESNQVVGDQNDNGSEAQMKSNQLIQSRYLQLNRGTQRARISMSDDKEVYDNVE